jgi:hypothetical protein
MGWSKNVVKDLIFDSYFTFVKEKSIKLKGKNSLYVSDGN